MPIDTPAWVRDAVFYQIFPDRFASSPLVARPGPLEPWDAPPTNHGFKGGDLLGIVDRLPYLADLGVTALYLTPIFASASNHRYHTDDYLTVDPLLGGDAALRVLLDAAHERGMRVILDGVFNHTGRGFFAFRHILENGIGSPYIHWYHVDHARLAEGRPLIAFPEALPGGMASLPGHGSFERLGYLGWWDMPALPKLDVSNPPTREMLLGVAEHWLREGADGWRLDVPEEIDDIAFWQEFRQRCRAAKPDAYIVGEVWHEATEWLAGDRFDAVMNYPLAEAILGFAAGPHLDRSVLAFHDQYRTRVHPLDGPAFAAELERIQRLYAPEVTAVQLNLIGSHDTPRFRTMAGGDREAVRLAVAVQATMPGAPCTYYGDEIGLEGGRDPDNRRAFPVEEARWDHDLRAFVRAAFALRHAEPSLRHGTFRIVGAAGPAVAYERGPVDSGDAWLVALNGGDEPADLTASMSLGASATLEPVLLPGWPSPVIGPVGDGGRIEMTLAPRAGAVVRVS